MTNDDQISNSIRLENTSCILGCSKNDEVILVGRDLIHNLPGKYTVVRCCSCGLMRTNPRPTPETIGFYYPDDYGPYLGTRVKPATQYPVSTIRKWLRSLSHRIFEPNTARLPSMPVGQLLEIGCASGAFLHRMAAQGWRVEGIEFSERTAQLARQLGYAVYAGSLEQAPRPDHCFDLIVGWMVLEHLHDPIHGLLKLHDWANPDAYLVLSVPNAGSLSFRLFKEKWYALHLPNHLYHYTPETVTRVLAAGGWTVEELFFQRVLTEWIASFGYVLRDKGYPGLGKKLLDFSGTPGRWYQILYPLAWVMSLFGQTGRMTVWARKFDVAPTRKQQNDSEGKV